MRTRVIPAQITTVEDKIAGNFSLTQIILLLTPVLFATLVYIALPPSMMFVWYKMTLTLLFSALSILLAIRVKGKIVASWLVVLTRYNLRPRYHVFNKNEIFARDICKPLEEVVIKTYNKKANVKEKRISPSITEILKLQYLTEDRNFDLRYKAGRKGVLNVAFEKITK